MPTFAGAKRIPIIGADIYQVGQVIDIVSQDCTPTPTIAVNAFFANVPMLAWSLVKPSPEDYLTDRLGQRHKRKRKNRFRMADFDIGPKPGSRGAAWVEFSTIKLLERVGWYMLVIDATTDFAVNWTSMAYRYSGCQEPSSGYGSTDNGGTLDWFAIGGNTQMGLGSPDWTAGYFASNSVVSKTAPGPRMVTWGVDIEPHPSSPKGTVSRLFLRQSLNGANIDTDGDASEKGSDNSQHFGGITRGYNTLEPPHNYAVFAEADGGWCRAKNFRLTVSGFTSGLEADP